MPSNRVASILMASDGQGRFASRDLPELYESRPRRSAEQVRIRGELALGQRTLIANLGHLGCQILLEELAVAVHPLLHLERVFQRPLAALLVQPLVRTGNGPLGDFDPCLQKLFKALSVEEILVSRRLLTFSFQGGSAPASHDRAQTISPLIGSFAEKACRLTEFTKFGFHLGIVGGHCHLPLRGLLFEGADRFLVLLPGSQHVFRCLVDDILIGRQLHVPAANSRISCCFRPKKLTLQAAIVNVRFILSHCYTPEWVRCLKPMQKCAL
mmetsp:Transcript_71583/g.149660  ORF Transcript_71583/g.149660 Transcript_71583/m.149660 type:complete len:269 (+) Transcript_71583:1062-1868(+)